MDNQVSLAAIALAGSAIGTVAYVVRYLANTLSKDIKEHTKAAVQAQLASNQLAEASKSQAKASAKSAQASQEVLTFMRKLNGKLENATIQKAKEMSDKRAKQ